tara:strand:- start:140 stop:877 length:738 start_codon:yes stop_codon:yes gene_type:complete
MTYADHTLNTPAKTDSDAQDVRTRIVLAAAELIRLGNLDAATTRAVASAAKVQAPTIYRLFGDKNGLLDAVAEHSLNAYVIEKSSRPPSDDPIQDLRDGWDMHVTFGLANPGLFAILTGDTDSTPASGAKTAGLKVLEQRVKNIALAGKLRTSERRAIDLLRSVGTGTVLTLLSQTKQARDPGLSDAAREAVIAAITGTAEHSTSTGPAGAAAALHASLPQTTVLSDGERHLLSELLERIARAKI